MVLLNENQLLVIKVSEYLFEQELAASKKIRHA